MKFTVYDFIDKQQCIDDLEALFRVACQQNQNLIIQCRFFTYLIRPNEGVIQRMRKWEQIYEETQSS